MTIPGGGGGGAQGCAIYMVPSSGRLPLPRHGMVQVGVQGQGRGMPLQPHH